MLVVYRWWYRVEDAHQRSYWVRAAEQRHILADGQQTIGSHPIQLRQKQTTISIAQKTEIFSQGVVIDFMPVISHEGSDEQH